MCVRGRLGLVIGLIGGMGAVPAARAPDTVLQDPTPSPPAAESNRQPDALQQLIDSLGDPRYLRREEATQQLLSRGPEIVPQLRARLAQETDPEIQHRLRYVLENLIPPRQAVLLIRAAPESGLQPGEVITHVRSRRVRNQSELRQRLAKSSRPALLRVRGPSGPREMGPVQMRQLIELSDYVAPRGEVLAQAVRLYATGLAEEAYRALRTLPAPIPEAELSKLLLARIAYTAGDGTRAIEVLADQADSVRASVAAWDSPSYLDLSGPGQAPHYLEWFVTTRGGQALDAIAGDPDLRILRVLHPARRYADALELAAGQWCRKYRDELGRSAGTDPVAGDRLALIAWMLHEMGLRSECCRLIEPRSAILRRTAHRVRKWIRVDTDAWLAFLAGDVRVALDGFYEDALGVLRRPPRPGEPTALVRNPTVAARVAFLLYQFPDDPRVERALQTVSQHAHPALTDYLDWMLYALREENQEAIRRDLQWALPHLPDDKVLPYASAVALLEYVQSEPDRGVLRAARRRVLNATAGEQRGVWLAICDALLHLVEGRPNDARRPLLPFRTSAEASALWHTAGFLSNPPVSAADHAVLRAPVLAVPLGRSGEQWLVLSRDRRPMHFDATVSLLRALERPTPTWFPNPLTWPWIGREERSGRVWVYCRRRVAEVVPDAEERASGLRIQPMLNLGTEQIAVFDRYVGPQFSRLAEAIAASPPQSGENSEFLRREIKAHGEYFADPDLPEVGMIQELRGVPRVVHVAMRGGPHLLIDAATGRSWTSLWIRDELRLESPPTFLAQALWELAPDGSPIVMLMSDQGLIRFDLANEMLTRIALPGPEPYPPLLPESVPYVRRDPRYLYCARRPEDGGQVYRMMTENGSVEAVDMVNIALPGHYYNVRLRSEIRAALDRRLQGAQLPDLESLIADAAETVARWAQQHRDSP